MAHNEDTDPDDDDDQHVHTWQPNSPPQTPIHSWSANLITCNRHSFWEMVSQRHHEVK